MAIKHTEDCKQEADFIADKFKVPVVLSPELHQPGQAIIFQARDCCRYPAISFPPVPQVLP
jgi:hypothetical protein